MRPKKVILCVDDNEQELSVLKFMLETNGYRVVPAASGQEAISLLSKGWVDLVLADFAMPQMNGHQLINRLKGMAPHIPMILLGEASFIKGSIAPADVLISKRLTSSTDLLELIRIMSARKRGPKKGTLRVIPYPAVTV